MYVDALSDALRAGHGGLTGEALVDHVVDSRVHLLSARVRGTPTAYDLLAVEIAYDVSLIRLCDDLGIATGVGEFANPLIGRTRIERALAEQCGLDLSARARTRATTEKSGPSEGPIA